MRILLLFSVFLMTKSVYADDSYKKIFSEKIKRYSIDKNHLGVAFSVNENGVEREVLSQNSDLKMIPASLTKVATASAVLEHFLPGSKFKTQLYLEATATTNRMKSSLYLKGGGDPSFVSENMWFLVNAFKRSGVEVVEGDILVDDTLFDPVRFDESREAARVDRAYDAPVGAMSFNWNSINVFVRAGKKGERAKVFLDPENEYTHLENKTKTVSGNKIDVQINRRKDGERDVLMVSGSIGNEANEFVAYKNITRPDLWSGWQLKAFLEQRGIKVTGTVKTGKTPSSAVLVAESESKPVEDILGDMMKFSNNYVAEMLCKNISLKKKTPGTIDNGMELVRDHLKSLGINSDQFELYNPSGLTRDNKMTPRSLLKILNHLHDDFRIQPELLRDLPISGIDGTLKRRMKGSAAERKVRAKTGLLTGIAALGGYLGLKDGKILTFVLIYNGPQDEAKVRQFYDDLLIDMVKL